MGLSVIFGQRLRFLEGKQDLKPKMKWKISKKLLCSIDICFCTSVYVFTTCLIVKRFHPRTRSYESLSITVDVPLFGDFRNRYTYKIRTYLRYQYSSSIYLTNHVHSRKFDLCLQVSNFKSSLKIVKKYSYLSEKKEKTCLF